MKTSRLLMTLMLVPFLLSCKSTRPDDKPEGETGVVGLLLGTTALVVATPLIPVGMTIGTITGLPEKSRERKLAKILDPVYRRRVEMIRERDPLADAKAAWESGNRSLLPAVPRGSIFPGLEGTDHYMITTEAGGANYDQLMQNELMK